MKGLYFLKRSFKTHIKKKSLYTFFSRKKFSLFYKKVGKNRIRKEGLHKREQKKKGKSSKK